MAKEVLLAVLIEGPEARNTSDRINDNCGAEITFEWYPPLPFRGPLLFFLRNRREEGLDLILDYVNFVTDVWASRHTRPNREPVGVSISFQDVERKWLGNGDVYYWYRDQPNCPDSVVVALMALEKWLYEELEAGHDVTASIEIIIRKATSLAFAGLLSAVGRKEISLFQNQLLPFLGVPNFLNWELEYNSQLQDDLNSYLTIVWQGKDETLRKEAYKWHTLPHRNTSLFEVALWHLFNTPSMSNYFENARHEWLRQLKAVKRNSTYKDKLEMLIERFNTNNYRTEYSPDHGEIRVFSPPENLRTKIEASRKELAQGYSVVSWPVQCRQILNGKVRIAEENLESIWSELLRVAESTPPESRITGHLLQVEHAVCGAIAVLVLLHRDWLRKYPDREQWCVKKLVKTILNPPQPEPLYFEGANVDWKWSSFSAQAMSTFWAEEPDSPVFRKCIALLATSSNINTVAYLFASASSKREELGPHLRQLQHLLRRWASEKWSRRFSYFDDLNDKSKEDVTRWLERESQSFIEGSTPSTVPTLRELFVLEPKDVYRGPQDDWRRSAHAPALDLSLIQAAYSWIPSLDQANSLEERAEWIQFWHEALDCTLDRLRAENAEDEEKEIDGLPYDWDHWVFGRLSGVILQLRQSEQPQVLLCI